ncbi:MAG: beta-ribofuranosylaminobenzene 5-phosphate synthase [Methanobacterium sp.]|nr:beta-ribofuranosylaminobenzene 5-phosphate synthase [Methanobacterium sp.]
MVAELIIETPSRLHLTLIDLNGSLGRIDGGVGLTLEKPGLVLEMEESSGGISVEFKNQENLSAKVMADDEDKIKTSARRMMDHLQLNRGYNFTVHETYLSHSGLGSGTQISLAVGKLISDSVEQHLDAPQIASIVGRGGTSGIGVASFAKGGFIVDAGHHQREKPDFLPSSASTASPPPIVARYDFPQDWKVVLIIPNVEKNISGSKEVNIFKEYCPVPLKEVQQLSHILLMKMMPAVLEKDLDNFGDSINRIQNIGFKKVENQLQNPIIGEIMQLLRDAGAPGVGMSSFGPTIYAVTDSPRDIVNVAGDALSEIGGSIIETRAQNSGAVTRY